MCLVNVARPGDGADEAAASAAAASEAPEAVAAVVWQLSMMIKTPNCAELKGHSAPHPLLVVEGAPAFMQPRAKCSSSTQAGQLRPQRACGVHCGAAQQLDGEHRTIRNAVELLIA